MAQTGARGMIAASRPDSSGESAARDGLDRCGADPAIAQRPVRACLRARRLSYNPPRFPPPPRPPMSQLVYRRVLLKLSGEALMGDEDYGIDPKVIGRLAREVIEVQQAGAEIALVIGGGNIFRGAGLAAGGMDRVTGDQMGMLATVINALAMQDSLEKLGAKVRVMSAIKINDVCEDYIRRRAIRHLEKGRLAIFAAGVGSPFFTTDSGAALRAIEIGADLLLKATKVDGVYDKDPKKHSDAVRFDKLSYDEVITRDLQVMDTAAFALCRDSELPLRIFDMGQPGVLLKILRGENIGTLVQGRG
jgi:uridylate kinase